MGGSFGSLAPGETSARAIFTGNSMSLMDDILATDAVAFTNSDEMGETVRYLPEGVEDDAREIPAGVERQPPAMVMSFPDTNAPMFYVLVANNATTGISAQEINHGLDTIQIKRNVGDTNYSNYRIKVIEKQDAGMLLLQVR